MLIFQTLYLQTVNYYFAHMLLLVRRLALAYAIYTTCRILFFIFHFSTFAAHSFPQIFSTFIHGLRVDTTAIVYVFSPVILLHLFPSNIRNSNLYQIVTKVFFMISSFVSLLLNLTDVGYFSFSGKRSGMELVRMQQAENVSPLTYVTDYWHLALLLLVMLFAVWKLYPKLKQQSEIRSVKQFIVHACILLVAGGIAFIGARGSIGLKPLNTLDAARFTSAELMPLTLNTPFQFLLTVQQVGVDRKHYMSDKEALALFNPHKTVPAHTTPVQHKNVVLIIVESLGKEYVGYFNNGKSYTPFLDSLMQHSTVYNHAYANGKRSIEGIPSIIAAMPSWMPSDYINSFYQSNTLHGIGYYLSRNGYDAGFYHGGKNGTMSFDKMVAATGTGTYYGLNEYPDKEKDFDGTWGIFDEPYLQYVAQEFNQKGFDKSKQAFFGTVFTLSSHHPYALPPQYKKVFKGGALPIYATIQYMDHALRHFFETARKMPWYRNTVFVITADHSSENTQPYYLTSAGKYEIPLIIFEWGQPHQVRDETIDQLNITDLVLNRTLPANTPYYSLAGKYAIQYDNGIYQLIDYPYVLKFDGGKTIEFYNTESDPLLQKNLVNQPFNQQKQNSLERYLKAVIQQYNNGLIDNKTH
jgi:phosphoglycerol transferase MdoB-like AlkP superfamily enzyme